MSDDLAFIYDDDRRTTYAVLTDLIADATQRRDTVAWHTLSAARWIVGEHDRNMRFGGTSGPAYEPGTPTRETPDQAQRLATTDQGEAAEITRPRAAASPTFSDPGDGYDSSIRHHADLERGNL